MIDNVAILLSTVLCMIVAVRALMLDRKRPWYDVKTPPGGDTRRSSRKRTAEAGRRPPPAPRPPTHF